jgi:hypothetical protein
MGGAVSLVPLSVLNTCTFVTSLALIWFPAGTFLHCYVLLSVDCCTLSLLKQNQLLELGNLSYLPFDSFALSQSVQINVKINK